MNTALKKDHPHRVVSDECVDVLKENDGTEQQAYYIARSLPQHQGIFHNGLKRHGIEYCSPMITTSRRTGRGGMRVLRTWMIPGYSFVRLPDRKQYDDLLITYGFQSLMRPGDSASFVVLLQPAIDLVMRVAQGNGKEREQLAFKVGQWVRVMEGPFTGFTGRVEAVPKKGREKFTHEDRIKVAVDIFGRPTPIELEIWQAEPEDVAGSDRIS